MLAVVSFDATDPARLDRLVAAGRMPHLAELRARGRSHQVSVSPLLELLEPATFYTLATGVPPERHGRCLPFLWDPERMRMVAAGPPNEPAIWDRISAAGRRSLVLDAYEIPAPAAIEGAFVRGVQHRNRVSMPRVDMPRPLGREARRALGAPPIPNEVYAKPTARGLRRERDDLLRGAVRPAEAVELLLGRVEPDLLWVTVVAAHIGGHRLWNLTQLRGRHDGAEELEGALDDVYAACDEALGRIVAVLPADADLIVVSPVGMDENPSRVDLLEGMVDAVLGKRRAGEDGRPSAVWRLRGSVPGGIRARAADLLPEAAALDLMLRMATPSRDWSQTQVFALPSDPNGYLRFNLRGREAAGVVDEGDVPAITDQLREGLLAFEDLEGGRAVAEVHDVRSMVSEAPAEHLPDLVVEWSQRPATRVTGVRSPRHGTIRRAGGAGGPTGRSGGHRADAWVVVVPEDGRVAVEREARLEDVAATACALLGADGDGLPGRALIE